MALDIVGCWRLLSWHRIEGDSVTFPLGERACGMLIYTSDFSMMVQMFAANRPQVDSSDPLGGDVDARAAAYSTCLAYFGSYEVTDDVVVHRIEDSLYANWSGAVQERPYSYAGDTLVLRTPPAQGPNGEIVNEISWHRSNPMTKS